MSTSDPIPGYSFGEAEVEVSRVSVEDLVRLKESAHFTDEDEAFLRRAGEVLTDQTETIVNYWRAGIIASIPNLAKHSRAPDGTPLPEYLARSNRRFQQWILDTCMRPYDQDWINYQQEIARRHTTAGKNRVDGVESTAYVPLRDVIAFIAVMNDTIRPYLSARGDKPEDVEMMHLAWCKSMQIQLALWIGPYADEGKAPAEW
jgi:hypothetical protein